MNAETQTEARAIAAVAPAPAPELILIPLSQLRPSRRNARRTIGPSIDALADSIQRVGLLQNLAVIAASDGEHYEVIAGGRRLAALKLLVKKHRIAKDWEAPCLLVADASARTVSLTENVQREVMHAADQFEAFAALVAEGRSIEDIAADFAVTPLVVQRRLKLAKVSPRLMADYRADTVSLDQLMALTMSDDHVVQEAAFYDAPEWQRNPSALRQRLTNSQIDATHALVRFVGLEAYIAAGGGIRRDLFAEDDSGVYLTDSAMLEALVRARLDKHAAPVRAEGWTWVDVTPAASYAELQAFHRAPREWRAPSKREAQRIGKLQARIQALDEAIDDAAEADNEDMADALQKERDSLEEEVRKLEEGLEDYSGAVRAASGAVVTVDRQGEIVVHRGLMREAEAKAMRAAEKLRHGQDTTDANAADANDGGGTVPGSSADLSDRLAMRLSAHRTAALQIEMAQHPQVALAALVHGMVQNVLQDSPYGRHLPLGVRLTVQDRLEGVAQDWPESRAAVALRELRQMWQEKLPRDRAELFAVLLAMPQEELVRLLSVCTAATLDAVTPRATDVQPGADIARAVGLDMAAWWKPTAEGYFKHVSKAAILGAMGEFAPDDVARVSKLKKAEIASEAERLAEGSGWMPAMFRADVAKKESPRECAELDQAGEPVAIPEAAANSVA